MKGRRDLLVGRDEDLIDGYEPFMQRFNDAMVKIHDLVENGQINEAIEHKRYFLEASGLDRLKGMLNEMIDTMFEIEKSL